MSLNLLPVVSTYLVYPATSKLGDASMVMRLTNVLLAGDRDLTP